jgi:hypothetical protein
MKRLILDPSSETVRRVTTILDENGIKYTLKTIRPRGSIGTGLDARSYAGANISMYKGSSQPQFVYSVYVRRKDYDRASDLIA